MGGRSRVMTGPWSGVTSKAECFFSLGFSGLTFCYPQRQCGEDSRLTADGSLCSPNRARLKRRHYKDVYA